MRRAASWGATLLVFLGGCQWSPTPRDRGYTIWGRVVDASTDQGLADVKIELQLAGSSSALPIGTTNAEGHFSESVGGEHDEAPIGQLRFTRAGYETERFEHVPTDSYLSMRLGCWETVPEVVELSPSP